MNKKPKRTFSKKMLESLAQVKVAERIVKPLGVVYLHNKIFHVNHKLEGEKVELWETLKRLEIQKERVV